MRLRKSNEVQTKIHIGTMRESQTYGVTSTWEPNGKSVLTRVPMFGKSLPLNNETFSDNEKVLCH
jgi:hypothetical protein